MKQLNKLIHIYLKSKRLSPQNAQKLTSLIIQTVSLRDMGNHLHSLQVSSTDDFEWQCRVKFRWDPATKHQEDDMMKHLESNAKTHDQITISAGIWSTLYAFEYLGTESRLILTPTAERVVMSMYHAMRQWCGGVVESAPGDANLNVAAELSVVLGRPLVSISSSAHVGHYSTTPPPAAAYRSLAQPSAPLSNRTNRTKRALTPAQPRLTSPDPTPPYTTTQSLPETIHNFLRLTVGIGAIGCLQYVDFLPQSLHSTLGEALHLIRRAVVNKQDSCVIDGYATTFAEVAGSSVRCVLPVGIFAHCAVPYVGEFSQLPPSIETYFRPINVFLPPLQVMIEMAMHGHGFIDVSKITQAVVGTIDKCSEFATTRLTKLRKLHIAKATIRTAEVMMSNKEAGG